MQDDAIVADIRQHRSELLEAAGGTLDALVQYLRQREREAGRTPVQLPPQALEPKSRAG
jgi:hypothetical protein